jgi:hypothetical protein
MEKAPILDAVPDYGSKRPDGLLPTALFLMSPEDKLEIEDGG